MPATVTKFDSDRTRLDRGPDVKSLIFEVQFSALTSTERVKLMDLPADFVMTRTAVMCLIPDLGATSSKVDIERNAGTVRHLGAADNLGIVSIVDDEGLLADVSAITPGAPAASELNVLLTIVGTATVSPKARIIVEGVRVRI